VGDLLLILSSTLVLSAPLILAAMGGLTSERSGIINIALEGKMLMAAAAITIVTLATGSMWWGLLAGIGAAAILALAHWLFTQLYQIDHIVSGMAINALAFGASGVLGRRFIDPAADALRSQTTFLLGIRLELPYHLFVMLGLAAPFLLMLYIRRTRGGLQLNAVGNSPDKSRQMGIEPARIRLIALCATGLFCGLAGAVLVTNVGGFTDGMTAGRGFIALAALILGGWRPVQAMLACFLFGLFEAIRIQFQGTEVFGATLPSQVWASLPYLVTIVALAGFLGRSRAPAGLGKP
jgi:general nucleoside transport system permease protein